MVLHGPRWNERILICLVLQMLLLIRWLLLVARPCQRKLVRRNIRAARLLVRLEMLWRWHTHHLGSHTLLVCINTVRCRHCLRAIGCDKSIGLEITL